MIEIMFCTSEIYCIGQNVISRRIPKNDLSCDISKAMNIKISTFMLMKY
jgi:hypothetical protein